MAQDEKLANEVRRLLSRRDSMLASRGRGTPTTTPTRPASPTRTPGPSVSGAAAPRSTPSSPASGQAPSLGALAEAFSPKFVLPKELRGERIRTSIRETQQAVQAVATEKGVSFQEAGALLRETGKQVRQAKDLRRQILRAQPGLSEREQIRFLSGRGLSSLARRSAGIFVPREIATFTVLSARR
jgi:hypothetical protein